MKTYYGLVTTKKEGKNVIIDNLPNDRTLAYQAAVEHCKKNELEFQEIRFVQGAGKQGSSITKFAKYRKQNKGQNPKSFDKAL